MSPDEAEKTASESTEGGAPRGRRRSRRGGRRHSRRREPRGPMPPSAEGAPAPEAAVEHPAESSQPAIEEAEQREQAVEETSYRTEPSHKTPAITDAITQVNRVIDELKHALDEMEEVLETLELAERQKIDDEREIQNLQRALRQLHHPRHEPRH